MKQDLTLEIDAAGIDPKLLRVTFVDNVVRIQQTDKPSQVRIMRIREPDVYDLKQATASYKFGLLTVNIPARKPVELDIPVTVDWS